MLIYYPATVRLRLMSVLVEYPEAFIVGGIGHLEPALGESRRLVTDEPVEFEKEPVEVPDFRRISDHFRGIYGRIDLK